MTRAHRGRDWARHAFAALGLILAAAFTPNREKFVQRLDRAASHRRAMERR